MKPRSATPAARRAVAVESFQTAAACIGPVTPGMSLFAVTRGQFSMLDAVLHVLDCLGPSRVSLWTWTSANHEIERLRDLYQSGRIRDGRLIIDYSIRQRNPSVLADWRAAFGAGSIRYVANHAKIAAVEGSGRKVLLRGSMNLNCNPRFEQLDVTEGGPDFDLVREIEDALPVLPDDVSGADAYIASKVGETLRPGELFGGLKRWER